MRRRRMGDDTMDTNEPMTRQEWGSYAVWIEDAWDARERRARLREEALAVMGPHED